MSDLDDLVGEDYPAPPIPAPTAWQTATLDNLDQILKKGMDAPGFYERTNYAIDEDHLITQREFSLHTFGPGTRLEAVIDHITKEIEEIKADPLDITEWADLIILAFDGALRQGFAAADILVAVVDKQRLNERRQWPNWRAQPRDKAIEHIKVDGLVGEREATAQKEAFRTALPADTFSDSTMADAPGVRVGKVVPVSKTTAPGPAVKSDSIVRGGRMTAADKVVAAGIIRAALAAGQSLTQAADAAGVSWPTAKKLAGRTKTMNPHPSTAVSSAAERSTPPPPHSSADLRPAAAPPAPSNKPRPSSLLQPPVQQLDGRRTSVPALGAARRIRSLFTIGYDHALLNARLQADDVQVGAVLAAHVAGEEIYLTAHQAINDLWRKLRYSPRPADPHATADRSGPPPGVWDNIDDPNEKH